MKIVEISASLGNGLKRYNVFGEVSMKKQPFTFYESILYGITKPTDIVQTNAPTNILVDLDGNPIGTSEPVYFGIRVHPFISVRQDFYCKNNNITYADTYIQLFDEYYFPDTSQRSNNVTIPDPYTGKLYPQPEFVESLGNYEYTYNYKQAMQQFINDCVFPTKPNLNLPGQSISSDNYYYKNGIPYFSPEICTLSQLKQREPRGILNLIRDEKDNDYKNYMVQFGGQNLNFKFGMATNSDFSEPPNIFLPYLYHTYAGLVAPGNMSVNMGVIMQCLLYDSNGKVISG